MRRKQCPFGGSWLLEPLWNHRSHDPSLPHLIASLFLGETWWNHILSSLSPGNRTIPVFLLICPCLLDKLAHFLVICPSSDRPPTSDKPLMLARLFRRRWSRWANMSNRTNHMTWCWKLKLSVGFSHHSKLPSYPKGKKLKPQKLTQKETIGFSKSYQLLWRSRAPPPDPPGLPFGVTTLHPWSPDTWHDVWRQKMGYTKHKFGDENIGKWGFQPRDQGSSEVL